MNSAPSFLYGTAWKEERTERHVANALKAGFRGIDTANQRKHYHEAGVGAAIASSGIARDQLFIQTKFTHLRGHDARLPYDREAPLSTQVRQSFDSSLAHLGVEYIDSYLLHGPLTHNGISSGDREVWAEMTALHGEGRARRLGISNASAGQIATLCEITTVRPAFVQNRCYASSGWDREVRALCVREGIAYQGFSLLTANQQVHANREIRTIATKHGRTPAQVIFRFSLQVGMICLTGTTDPDHMREDLDSLEFELEATEVAQIESIAG